MAVARASRKSPAATCNLFVKVKRCFVCAPPPVIEPRDETTVLPRCLSRPRTRRNFGNLFCPRRYSRHPRAHPQDSSKMKVCTFQTAKRKSPRVPGVTAEMEGRGGGAPHNRARRRTEERTRQKKKGGEEKGEKYRASSSVQEVRNKRQRERENLADHVHPFIRPSISHRSRENSRCRTSKSNRYTSTERKHTREKVSSSFLLVFLRLRSSRDRRYGTCTPLTYSSPPRPCTFIAIND